MCRGPKEGPEAVRATVPAELSLETGRIDQKVDLGSGIDRSVSEINHQKDGGREERSGGEKSITLHPTPVTRMGPEALSKVDGKPASGEDGSTPQRRERALKDSSRLLVDGALTPLPSSAIPPLPLIGRPTQGGLTATTAEGLDTSRRPAGS